MLSSAFEGKSPIVQQVLDFQDRFDIGAAVETMAGGGALGPDAVEFGLPKPQNISRQPGDFAHFTDFEVKLVGDVAMFLCL